ncbi:MAG: HU family DNA-binding protein [Nitrospira sp.]|nr:HU family DNA-binding protein [Nitrospira sp.]
MTKAELIEKIAISTGISKKAANNALLATLDNIVKALQKGQKVTLLGFGTFSVHERKPHTGRNPKTGEVINVPSARIPKFIAGKALKSAVK